MSDIKHQFINAITDAISGICTHGDDLRIMAEDADGGKRLCVYPHQADYPKLVGAKGRTVNAITHLFVRAAVNLNWKVGFVLEQSFVGRREDRIPFSYNPDFDVPRLEAMVRPIVQAVLPAATVSFSVNGEDVQVLIHCDRGEDNHTTVAAINALFYPYGFAQGRMVNVRLGLKV